METSIILVIQIILLIGITFISVYVKQLPRTLQEKTLKKFQHSLDEKLELLKISHAELQTLKRNEFIRFSEFWRRSFENKSLLKNSKHINELNSIGLNFFFFASDEVVKKFVELRTFLLYNNNDERSNQKKALIKKAELNLLMRKDLGYDDTNCDEDDFLNILLNDWERFKTNN